MIGHPAKPCDGLLLVREKLASALRGLISISRHQIFMLHQEISNFFHIRSKGLVCFDGPKFLCAHVISSDAIQPSKPFVG